MTHRLISGTLVLALSLTGAAYAEAADPEALIAKGQQLVIEADDTDENLNAALAAYDRALQAELSPERRVNAYSYKALAYLKLGDRQRRNDEKARYYDLGRQQAQKAIQIDAECADCFFIWGSNVGRFGEAQGIMRSLYLLPRVRAAFERALQIDPGHVNTIVAQGELDMILPRIAGGSKKRAEALYRRALELDPHHTRAMALLAELLAQQGRRREASEMARQVLAEETPTYPGERRKFDGPRAERLLERL